MRAEAGLRPNNKNSEKYLKTEIKTNIYQNI